MNILYCGDGNTADGILISVLSLCHSADEPINIYILTASVSHGTTYRKALPKDFAVFLESEIKKYDIRHTVKLVDITDLFEAEKPVANMDTRFTPCCMLRLYADKVDILPDRILYLDNDVICRRNPAKFYYLDMENHSVAGSLDYYGSWFFKSNIIKRDYLNSGVLLLNLKKIRENGLFLKCRIKCADEEMFMPDQSAINKLCKDKLICHRRYNEQKKLKKDTVFQHFTTGFRFFPFFHTVSVKPWNIKGMHEILKIYEYDDILQEFLTLKENYIYVNKQ